MAKKEFNGPYTKRKREAHKFYFTQTQGTASITHPDDDTTIVHYADPPKKRGKLKDVTDGLE